MKVNINEYLLSVEKPAQALSHHLAPISNEMKIFQELDDK